MKATKTMKATKATKTTKATEATKPMEPPAGVPFVFYSKETVRMMVGDVSNRTLENLVKDGVLPKPFQLYKRLPVWRSDELLVALNKLKRHNTKYCGGTGEVVPAAPCDN